MTAPGPAISLRMRSISSGSSGSSLISAWPSTVANASLRGSDPRSRGSRVTVTLSEPISRADSRLQSRDNQSALRGVAKHLPSSVTAAG